MVFKEICDPLYKEDIKLFVIDDTELLERCLLPLFPLSELLPSESCAKLSLDFKPGNRVNDELECEDFIDGALDTVLLAL